MNKSEMLKAKKIAIEAALTAGKFQLKYFGKDIEITKKGPRNYFTEIDVKSEKKILAIIRKAFPDHKIFSEEIGFVGPESDYVWYVDPLDGTHNYMHGTYPWGVSVGLTYKKESLVGAIYIPLTDEMFVGAKGMGATCNGKTIKVSKNKTNNALVEWTSKLRTTNRLKTFNQFAKNFEMIRMRGSAAQDAVWLASGSIEVIVFYNIPAYDVAAGYVILKEAGARITDFKGKVAKFDNGELLMTNGTVHNAALKITRSIK